MRYRRHIALIFMVLSSALPFAAAEEAEEVIPLPRIIITNRRVPVSPSDAVENISVIYEDDIEALSARDVSEVLSYVPGIDIEPRSGFGQATSITIQGSNSRHVRVMIDGIPLNLQSSGQVNPAELPIENLDRIEAIKGAASSIWGSSLGGVINAVTKDTGDTPVPKVTVKTSIAQSSTEKGSAGSSRKQKATQGGLPWAIIL